MIEILKEIDNIKQRSIEIGEVTVKKRSNKDLDIFIEITNDDRFNIAKMNIESSLYLRCVDIDIKQVSRYDNIVGVTTINDETLKIYLLRTAEYSEIVKKTS